MKSRRGSETKELLSATKWKDLQDSGEDKKTNYKRMATSSAPVNWMLFHNLITSEVWHPMMILLTSNPCTKQRMETSLVKEAAVGVQTLHHKMKMGFGNWKH